MGTEFVGEQKIGSARRIARLLPLLTFRPLLMAVIFSLLSAPFLPAGAFSAPAGFYVP